MSAPSLVMDAQSKVQETADDAALSKLSSVRMGYIKDPFIKLFVDKFQRRSPLINRGYFARMAAVDSIVSRFIAISQRTGTGACQVVSLGAGMDTTFFRSHLASFAPTTYFEVDFPDVTAKKAGVIRSSELLQACIAGQPIATTDLPGEITGAAVSSPALVHGSRSHTPASSPAPAAPCAPTDSNPHGITYHPAPGGGQDVHGPKYRLVTSDLRDVAALQAGLKGAGFDPEVPTLFLSECVLVYLEPEDSCAIIAWAAKNVRRSVFVTYEQIRPHDAFGQVMARNLEERGYALRGLHAFPDIQAQISRYQELGYGSCTVIDMNDVYYRLLPRADVARIERLEMFDELEEWHLMSAHYAIAVAVNEVDVEGDSLPESLTASSTGPRSRSGADARTGAAAGLDARDEDVDKAHRMHSGSSTPSSTATPASKMARTGPSPSPSPTPAHLLGLSPRELAQSVVASHEEAEAQGGHVHVHSSGSARAGRETVGGVGSLARGRSSSPSPSVQSLGSLSGRGGSGTDRVRSVPGPMQRSARDRSWSASMQGMESETESMSAGMWRGSGADHGLVSTANKAYAGSGTRTSQSQGTPMSVVGPTALSPTPSLSASGHLMRAGSDVSSVFRTEVGNIVLGTSGTLDFEAIAAADDELSHARAVREALGIDILRDTGEDIEDTASVASAGMSMSGRMSGQWAAERGGWEEGGEGATQGLQVEAIPRSRGESHTGSGLLSCMPPPPNSTGTPGKPTARYSKAEVAAMLMAPVQANVESGSAGGNSSHLYRPALDASRHHSIQAVSAMAPRPAYDATSIQDAAAAGRHVSLHDMLFPVDAWSAPSALALSMGSAHAAGASGRLSVGSSVSRTPGSARGHGYGGFTSPAMASDGNRTPA